MSRGRRLRAIALLTACLTGAWIPAQGNQGVLFSEVVFGPVLPPVGGVPMPSYVELCNVKIANPTVPPPVNLSGAIVSASANGGPFQTFSIPSGVLIGPVVQPLPAPQPPVPPPNKPVVLLASGPFPAGIVPSGVPVVIAPPLFTGANAILGAPGVPFELCLVVPSTGQTDRVHLGAPTAVSCATAAFNNTLTFQPNSGWAIRWTYMDSNTDIDFDPGFAVSTGVFNPEMTHVNGFFFGTPTSSSLGGAPLQISGSATSGTLSLGPFARVKGVHFVNPLFNRTVTNPAFDPIINAPVAMSASFIAQNPSISQPGFLPGLQILSETMTITAPTPAGSGVLDMPMQVSMQVGANIGPSAQSPGDIRPERIFSDLVSDSAPFVSGSPTAAEIDVIPPSTGGGNVWCEIIVYDYQGNQYRAKVKNWPSGGVCNGPLLGLGTDGMQSFTLIDLCFTPGSMVANLFSASPAATCGGPLLPAGGICPDAYTIWILSPPQLGSAPFFVTADAGGLYLFQVGPGTLAALAGMMFEAIGVEYTPAGIVQQSAVNAIML